MSSVCCLLCFTSSRISSAALPSSLFLRRCLDHFCRIFLVSSSNFSTPSNSFAVTMISDSLFELSLQRFDPSIFPFHFGSRGNSELQHLHQSVSSATRSSYATLLTTSSRSFLSWLLKTFELEETRIVRWRHSSFRLRPRASSISEIFSNFIHRNPDRLHCLIRQKSRPLTQSATPHLSALPGDLHRTVCIDLRKQDLGVFILQKGKMEAL